MDVSSLSILLDLLRDKGVTVYEADNLYIELQSAEPDAAPHADPFKQPDDLLLDEDLWGGPAPQYPGRRK